MLADNWEAVQVFRRCRPIWITGMHKPVYDGISAQEIEAAARMERVPPDHYPDLMACLDVLISTTRTVLATN